MEQQRRLKDDKTTVVERPSKLNTLGSLDLEIDLTVKAELAVVQVKASSIPNGVFGSRLSSASIHKILLLMPVSSWRKREENRS